MSTFVFKDAAFSQVLSVPHPVPLYYHTLLLSLSSISFLCMIIIIIIIMVFIFLLLVLLLLLPEAVYCFFCIVFYYYYLKQLAAGWNTQTEDQKLNKKKHFLNSVLTHKLVWMDVNEGFYQRSFYILYIIYYIYILMFWYSLLSCLC